MLKDLDELVLKCRDERARAYIGEAVSCYKAGAYRSAIVSTWIAVAFDITDKIYELSVAGDAQAVKFIADYENYIATDNNDALLKIERELLTTAKDKYELISAQEYSELERLRQDRHRCAHPSRSAFPDVFTPTPELARVHIRTAVEALLQNEPSQGKAALVSLQKLIVADYFPSAVPSALKYLEGTPLKRARPSLVRNLLLVCLKGAIDPNLDYKIQGRLHAAIQCIKIMHAHLWLAVVQADLTRIVRAAVLDGALANTIELLRLDSQISDALADDQLTRLGQFLLHCPKNHLHVVETALGVPQLNPIAKRAIASMTFEEVDYISIVASSEEVIQRVVDAYSDVMSFDSANKWAGLVAMFASALTAAQVTKILNAAATNGQIKASFDLGKVVIPALAKHPKLPQHEFDALIAAIRQG